MNKDAFDIVELRLLYMIEDRVLGYELTRSVEMTSLVEPSRGSGEI